MAVNPCMSDSNRLRLSEDEYDFAILHPALRNLYAGTDLYNYGFWRGENGGVITSLAQASTRLVRLHLEVDPAPGSGRRVLDVGCGLGACTALLARGYPEAEVLGVNYSSRQIAYAESRYAGKRIAFRKMDACAIDLPDRSVDCIHAIEAAMHFRPRSRFFDEARRLLVPGGRFILTDILADRECGFVPAANCMSSTSGYIAALQDAGFRLIEMRDIYADTVKPFVDILCQNAMPAYARGISRAVWGYVLVVAVSPD